MKEISEEMAEDMGYLPSALPVAYKSVEWCSILSPATERHFAAVYTAEKSAIRKRYGVDENGIVKVHEKWLKKNGFITS